MTMSMTKHPLWPQIREYVRIEIYSRDGIKHPRMRIEFKSGMPHRLRSRLLAATMPCVACGSRIHFARTRAAKTKRGTPHQHLYYAVTCPLDVNIGCSRGKAAAAEYSRVENQLIADGLRGK